MQGNKGTNLNTRSSTLRYVIINQLAQSDASFVYICVRGGHARAYDLLHETEACWWWCCTDTVYIILVWANNCQHHQATVTGRKNGGVGSDSACAPFPYTLTLPGVSSNRG